ncbi:hypothetical protein [Oryza sativa Japonica Group]|uniref:Uncharacterized protein n=2 Tax=Oryza sativa subsp. japonica TaxID=39947 RepID=Q657Q5_ORYSJ|nr:hypothetical protein [Oryza sativa Japonica Group]BAD45308.1 hypothetical protein [Oryza sativa Japonica Group]
MIRGWGLDRPWLHEGTARARLPAWPARTLIVCCTPPPTPPMLEDSLGGDSGDDGVEPWREEGEATTCEGIALISSLKERTIILKVMCHMPKFL